MVHYSAPGKLFISGEWAVLEKGNLGLVAAVNHRVHVFVEENKDCICITAEEFGIKDVEAHYRNGALVLDCDDKKKGTLKLLTEAVAITLKFLEENDIDTKNFKITTSSKETLVDIDGEKKKIGFGSSAAVVVATVAGLLDFHDYRAKKEEIYKLAAIAHYFAQGKMGSGFDVAASTYGGLFVYSRFGPEELTKSIEQKKLYDVVKERWPFLLIEELPVPEDFRLLVGWTKNSASTTAMIKQMNEFKATNSADYLKHYGSIAAVAERSIEAFKKHDKGAFMNCLKENERLLAELGGASGVDIETPELKRLAALAAEAGGAGKLSGAGGGDCGIAVCFDDKTEEKIRSVWKKEGFCVVDASLDRDGAKKER